MPVDMFVALTAFAFVMAFTPGPNNIMLTASGVNFGFMRSIPHMLGVEIGFLLLVVSCAAGLGVVLTTVPTLQWLLKIAGAAYMLWLAWKVANAGHASDNEAAPLRPMTFWQAVAFQWINPKGVVAALSGVAIYIRPTHAMVDFVVILAIFALATIGSVMTWTGFGVALRNLLSNPRHARIFNVAMAVLLVVSILPMVL